MVNKFDLNRQFRGDLQESGGMSFRRPQGKLQSAKSDSSPNSARKSLSPIRLELGEFRPSAAQSGSPPKTSKRNGPH